MARSGRSTARRRATWLLLRLLAAALAGPAFGADSDRIVIMVGGIDKQIYLPAPLAEQLGYFRDEGLDVELQSEPSGVHAEDELLAGAVQGVVGFYDHTVDLQAKGKAVVSVVQFSQAPGEVLLVAARLGDALRSPADLKGRVLGVTGLGSSTNFLTIFLAAAGGVRASELNLVPVGAGATFITALKQGRIDGGMTTEPTASRLLKSGAARIMVDLRRPDETERVLGGLYPAACLYMQSAWVEAHRVQVQRLANAFVRTLRFIQTHGADEIAARMPPDYYAGDRELYVRALANGKATFTPDGRMPASGPPTVLRVLAASSKAVQGKQIDLARTYTTTFVDAVK